MINTLEEGMLGSPLRSLAIVVSALVVALTPLLPSAGVASAAGGPGTVVVVSASDTSAQNVSLIVSALAAGETLQYVGPTGDTYTLAMSGSQGRITDLTAQNICPSNQCQNPPAPPPDPSTTCTDPSGQTYHCLPSPSGPAMGGAVARTSGVASADCCGDDPYYDLYGDDYVDPWYDDTSASYESLQPDQFSGYGDAAVATADWCTWAVTAALLGLGAALVAAIAVFTAGTGGAVIAGYFISTQSLNALAALLGLGGSVYAWVAANVC